MGRPTRISGLYDSKRAEFCKLVYTHRNADGMSCVNGKPSGLKLRSAGKGLPDDSKFTVIVPPDIKWGKGDFLSLNSGETTFRIGDGGNISVVCPGFVCVSARIEIWRPIKTGILTVSDKGVSGEREDTAGPALADMAAAIGAVTEQTFIVPDEKDAISGKIIEWADKCALDLVLTTGGTGLSARDVTPEVLTDIGDRIVPGFGEIMRARAMYYTPRGFLSRGIAVTRGKTLIIAFPGSERAVRQCFEAIAPALRHGVEILIGRDAECGG